MADRFAITAEDQLGLITLGAYLADHGKMGKSFLQITGVEYVSAGFLLLIEGLTGRAGQFKLKSRQRLFVVTKGDDFALGIVFESAKAGPATLGHQGECAQCPLKKAFICAGSSQ